MFELVFIYEGIEETEKKQYKVFADAVYWFIEFYALPCWDKEFKEIKILKNKKDITKKVKKFLEG